MTWHTKKIEELGEVITGTTPSTRIEEYYGGPYKLISPADLDNGRFVKTAHKLITEKGLSVTRPLPPKTILVGCIGNVGKIGLTVDEKSATNQQINALICNSDNDSEFVYYLFRFHRKLLESRAVKTTVPILNKTNFERIELLVPELNLQKKISSTLSTIQKAIEVQEEIIKTVTQLKKALMQKLFTEGTRGEPQKQTEIGPIPESWDVVELKDVSEKPQYGFTESAARDGNVKFLRITDITDDGVNWDVVPYCSCPSDKLENYLLRNGDIVFARIGATTGKSYLIKNPPKAIFASYLIRVRANSKVDPKYLYFFFQSSDYWKQISSHKGTSLKGGVNGSILSKLRIPLAKEIQQIEIASALRAVDEKIRTASIRRTKLNDLFNSLLHQLMSGEIQVSLYENID